MEKSAQLLSHSSGERQAGLVGDFTRFGEAQWNRGVPNQSHMTTSGYSNYRCTDPGTIRNNLPPQPKKKNSDWNGNRCCSPHLHLNISNLKKVLSPYLHLNLSDLKKVIFLDVRKSLLPNNQTWWEMTGGSNTEGKYRCKRSKQHASLQSAFKRAQASPFLSYLLTWIKYLILCFQQSSISGQFQQKPVNSDTPFIWSKHNQKYQKKSFAGAGNVTATATRTLTCTACGLHGGFYIRGKWLISRRSAQAARRCGGSICAASK